MSGGDSGELAALLGSRICHDLVSPLGAIGNGVELLQMSGMEGSPELELISESVACANARIRFFRIAYGAGAPDQTVTLSEIREILDLNGKGRKIQVNWNGSTDLPRDEARLVFLLLQCLESCLSWGGDIMILHEPAVGIRLVAEAERLRDLSDLWSVLDTQGHNGVAASEVHFALARHAATELGRAIFRDLKPTRIEVGF
ncbi:hypothetical protein LCGC14_1897570 [marine sediment metagenome]|uniref:Histidine phosphotransferase ChpT C-terminal domain-containing protein n=1 Tax=marine sediment metagenome TaxID=412755 RepID=A0A0F9IVM1_9ZZZZ